MAERGKRRKRGVAPVLDLGSNFGFPFRQEVRLTHDPGVRVESTARAILQEAGFDLVERPGSVGASAPAMGIWVGERGLRRKGITSSTAVFPIIAVFVAGSILGGLDAYIVGSPVVGVFWVLGAAATSAIFWLRYGGTYDSDLVLLTVQHPSTKVGSPPLSASAVFWAARVRSQIHADLRIPSVVSGPLKLAAEVGSISREFERRISTRPDNEEGRRGATQD